MRHQHDKYQVNYGINYIAIYRIPSNDSRFHAMRLPLNGFL